MIELGELQLGSGEAARSARGKVALLAERLFDDGLQASRLAAATSAVARAIRANGAAPSLHLGLRSGSVTAELVMSFHGELPPAVAGRLPAFFDRLEQLPSGLAGIVEIPGPVPERDCGALRGIVQQKSRDELMQEVREQNEALEESLENLKRTRSAKDRLESELNIGREIQMSMLPLRFPIFPDEDSFQIHATLHPAQQVGGDFYDIFLVDDDHLCFSVGDVSGKGVPAALFMAVTKTLIKSYAGSGISTSQILNQVNDEQVQGNDSCMFVTILLGILNIRTGRLLFSNAGHNPPLLRRAGGELERLTARHGPIVGAMEGLEYGEDEIELHPGDLLYLYTDGINEAMNASRDLYGEDRLIESIEALAPQATAEQAVNGTVEPVWHFQGDAPQADDITVVALRYLGAEAAELMPRLALVLENQESEIARAQAEFTSFAESHGLPVALVRKICLCLDDLIINIISYGYSDDARHDIELDITLGKGQMEVRLADDGAPFDPFAGDPPDTDLPIEERAIGGLGRHLVMKLMDRCEYRREGDKNIIMLYKAL